MGNKKRLTKAEIDRAKFFIYDDHPLVTRRDFLGAGIIPFSAYVMAPTVLQALMSSAANAATCVESGTNTSGSGQSPLPPFVQLNLSGGAGLSGNFVGRDDTGQLITSYSLMGLGSRALLESPRTNGDATKNRLESEMGATNGFYYQSGFLRGLREVALTAGLANDPTATQAVNTARAAARSYLDNTAFIGIFAQSRDDSNMNHYDLSSLVAAAGVKGSVLPIIGTGFGQTPVLVPPPSPLSVSQVGDLDSAVGVQGPLGNGQNVGQLTPAQTKAVFDTINKLSEAQALALLSSNASEIENLVACSTEKNALIDFANKPATDARTITALQQIWTINNNTGSNNTSAVFASCLYNHLIGQSGSVRLNMGGYDYHNNTRNQNGDNPLTLNPAQAINDNSGDQRDREAGRTAGKLLQTAAALGKRLVLYVTTDGSTRSTDANDDRSVWVSDRGQAGVAFLMIYDPNGRPAVSAPSGYANQIGALVQGQSADNQYLPNWNEERAALAAFANYLKFGLGQNWKTAYDAVVRPAALTAGLPEQPITDADMPKVIRV